MNEHKEHRRRWKCPNCGVEGWSRDGSIPADHDRRDGRVCVAYAKARLPETVRNNEAAKQASR